MSTIDPSAPVRVAILGASGYTGAELIRFLLRHPRARIVALTGERAAGKPVAEVFPHLAPYDLPALTKIADVDWSGVDFVFCGLPHGTTQEVIAGLPEHVRICDLSADFRLFDVETYAQWYGHAHKAPALQENAVYGLSEITREAVAKARLVANPGCYPTASQLPLIPLLQAGLIEIDDIIIDAKSGVSGAGRDAKQGSLFTEVTEGIHPYGIASHRHAPEIEQGLTQAAGKDIVVAFTPHLMPMARGILATTYVKLKGSATADDLRDMLRNTYKDEPFVKVLADGVAPQTRHVRASNLCLINVFADRLPGRAIIISAIDNLVKGASGQAIQNFNIMYGFEETLGLDLVPVFP
ncbi:MULTISPECIES: N-acetyl-gamma-glutamyl-phosphate reductase [Azospirillaceae]|uniref:N-acetyl-gamma-glutamyl-phosphate reductase n=1 Tax=Azospirillaceae TaxID=2829815 RepID=UPI000B67F29A|nr:MULTISPECIES: N-acetyl-gamma-glutamyl-phosphate reductase [Azospirillaceae]MDG5493360.1 N-acetyl-gamma-glutamyl-phosphate reductase [Niveispirillum sp. BGYR6]SNS80070.1 N-acetyl-gamma-glutamyl-phosphate reductase [Azospirillum sp. RU38E]SNS97316.1 N-acetyl-gamma-glutamyl-phosphate reductase [Azospirillum sp. RU37A]